MSLKAELEEWVRATDAFDAGDYEASLEIFEGIADSAKIHFNIGLIMAMLGDFQGAVHAYIQALSLDQYFAVAYFQKGVANMSLGDFSSALDDFNDALLYLRGNLFIDYTQIGLDYKLYSCDVLYNRGLCQFELGDKPGGMNDLLAAQQDRKEKRHNIFSRAIDNAGAGCPLIAVPKGTIYRPSESKVKNTKKVDYLGNSKVVAAMDGQDNFTGFHGAVARKANQDQTSNPIPQSASATMMAQPFGGGKMGSGMNPYRFNQFTRKGSAVDIPRASTTTASALSRSATTVAGGRGGGMNPNLMLPYPNARKGNSSDGTNLHSHATMRHPSSASGDTPPNDSQKAFRPHMLPLRRIQTDLPRNLNQVQSAPFVASNQPSPIDEVVLDERNSGRDLPNADNLRSYNMAQPGPSPGSARLPPGPVRAPTSLDKTYHGAFDTPLAGTNNSSPVDPHAPLDHLGSGGYGRPSDSTDDTHSIEEVTVRHRLNLPKGKMAVKLHYRQDILKIVADAHITYDDLLGRVQVKLTKHHNKLLAKTTADHSPVPASKSNGLLTAKPSPDEGLSPGINPHIVEGAQHAQRNSSIDYSMLLDSLNPSSCQDDLNYNTSGLGSTQPTTGQSHQHSPLSSASTLPPSPSTARNYSNGLGAPNVHHLRIKYRDEDNELVLLTDQEDLEMAKGYMGGDMSCPSSNIVERLELWCVD
ncbi:hypothetical protein IWQ62_000232 [Dispira parvispora]|uniref:PB1 domain-containing protein n=1 Tax=Dispira parvispora TaxID=1520584 RepID=A0A9W8E9V8_9FUNG|nr:hypothetical protein IWQ62_000232 [Dispira parvispora]